MPISERKYKSARISQNPEQPPSLKELYEKAKKKRDSNENENM